MLKFKYGNNGPCCKRLLLEGINLLLHEGAETRWGLGDDNAGILERGNLLRSTTLATRDDGTGVAHAAAGRRGEASNERDDGLAVGARVVLLEKGSSLLLGRATDLADHDDTVGLGVLKKDAEAVNKIGTVEGITANADAERLAKANAGGLADSLVGEGAGARNDADAARHVNVAGHDANLAGARLDDAGAVGADEARLVLADEGVLDTDHVLLGNALGDADGKGNFSLDGLHNGGTSKLGRDVDDSGIGVGLLHSLLHRGKDGQAEVLGAGLGGGDAADHVGAVLNGLLAVEGALLASKALADDARVLANLECSAGGSVAHGAH
eukprot:m.288062 g.288062  ORF g.288062 m.288062 type:complete len:325 (+) comp11893_c0_seq1:162-1136(+)